VHDGARATAAPRCRRFTVLAAVLICAFSSAAAPAPAESASRFATLDGMKVHYESYGAGRDAVVFVHGWTCDLTFWKAQVPAFAAKTRTLAIDLPGHGRSDAPRTTYSMDLFARAIDAVMRDAGVDRAVLVGHSMGTPVVRQFYRRYRRRRSPRRSTSP
jgi:pimeloyl-ACP methyl ester carboxylesterase